MRQHLEQEERQQYLQREQEHKQRRLQFLQEQLQEGLRQQRETPEQRQERLQRLREEERQWLQEQRRREMQDSPSRIAERQMQQHWQHWLDHMYLSEERQWHRQAATASTAAATDNSSSTRCQENNEWPSRCIRSSNGIRNSSSSACATPSAGSRSARLR